MSLFSLDKYPAMKLLDGMAVAQCKESSCQYRRRGFDPWIGKIPWRRKLQATPVFLPGKSHGQRSVVICSNSVYLGFPGGSDGKESACNAGDLGSKPGQEDPLKKGMATHSSILAWRTPWMEESGELQSMWSQRVGHD